MKKLGAVLALVLASPCCEPFDPVDENAARAKAEALEAFDKWVDESLKGNAEANFAGVSSHLKSRWLYDRLREDDSLAREWRGRLTGNPRTELDLWIMDHDKKTDLVQVLPPSVLGSPSLAELWKQYFKLQFPAIKQQLSRVAVADVYPDASGVSILLRNSVGPPEMYELVLEVGTWKINHHKLGPGHLNR